MDIKRAKRDRWILGVCGGIGHTYGLSPNLVRLAAVLASALPVVTLPIVVLAYVVAGIFLPETEEF